jgi:hypothetical protein
MRIDSLAAHTFPVVMFEDHSDISGLIQDVAVDEKEQERAQHCECYCAEEDPQEGH